MGRNGRVQRRAARLKVVRKPREVSARQQKPIRRRPQRSGKHREWLSVASHAQTVRRVMKTSYVRVGLCLITVLGAAQANPILSLRNPHTSQIFSGIPQERPPCDDIPALLTRAEQLRSQWKRDSLKQAIT